MRPLSWLAGWMLCSVVGLAVGCADEELSPAPHGAGGLGGGAGEGGTGAGGAGAGGAGGWATPFAWTPEQPFECPPSLGPDDLLAELLGELGLDRTVGIPKALYENAGGHLAGDPARLSFFHELQQDIDSIPCYAGNMAGRADAAVSSDHPLAALVANGAAALDLSITVGGSFPEPDPDEPLVWAVDLLHAGEPWDTAGTRAAATALPLELRTAAARILVGALEAKARRDEALAVMGGGTNLDVVYDRGTNNWLVAPGFGLNPDSAAHAGLFTGSQEGSTALYEGAARLAQAVDEAAFAKLGAMTEPFELYVDTPLGAVLIRGGADDVYDPDADPRLAAPLLLVIDTGGNDRYEIPAGATTSASHAISVHVDLGGNDTYAYKEVADPNDQPGLLPSDADGRFAGDKDWGPFSLSKVARQGSGVLGYGYLLDLGGGDDTYRSPRKSQGFANFGVGVLWDDGGSDSYQAENGAQGSALVGIAVLYDGGGDDSYRSYGSSQGFGWVSSYGLLYDAAGDDHYELVVDEVLLFYSPQTPGKANSSIGQGTAFGWRRDKTGTHLAGGLALLRDKAGHDSYEGSTFVQGTGYWMGLGVLADAEGNDQYNGLFYAQGATAHFALAAFLEGGGNDSYNEQRPALHSSIGLAHDFSVTFFVDDAGDDRYFGPDRSIGASKCHGLAVFVDNAGNDTYQAHERAIGWATDYDWAENTCGDSDTLPTYGFFVDAGGTDVYDKPDPSLYGDDTLWVTDDPVDATANELAGGIDASAGKTYAFAYGSAFTAASKP